MTGVIYSVFETDYTRAVSKLRAPALGFFVKWAQCNVDGHIGAMGGRS